MARSFSQLGCGSWMLPNCLKHFKRLPYWAAGMDYRQVSNIRRHFSRQLNCWSLSCCWSIACQRCSNYIFILYITPGFNGLVKDNCKTRQESFKFWDLVHLILENLRYVHCGLVTPYGIRHLRPHSSRSRHAACLVPSHYLNQWSHWDFIEVHQIWKTLGIEIAGNTQIIRRVSDYKTEKKRIQKISHHLLNKARWCIYVSAN